jgi:hypothetical protein
VLSEEGYHGSDLAISSGLVNANIASIQAKALEYMKRWLAEWKPNHSIMQGQEL